MVIVVSKMTPTTRLRPRRPNLEARPPNPSEFAPPRFCLATCAPIHPHPAKRAPDNSPRRKPGKCDSNPDPQAPAGGERKKPKTPATCTARRTNRHSHLVRRGGRGRLIVK